MMGTYPKWSEATKAYDMEGCALKWRINSFLSLTQNVNSQFLATSHMEYRPDLTHFIEIS